MPSTLRPDLLKRAIDPGMQARKGAQSDAACRPPAKVSGKQNGAYSGLGGPSRAKREGHSPRPEYATERGSAPAQRAKRADTRPGASPLDPYIHGNVLCRSRVVGKPIGFALALVAVFLGAVVLGRLLLVGNAAWGLVLLAAPFLVALMARLTGFPAALLVLGVFVLVALASRSLLAEPKAGWVVFLLVPVAALTTGLAASVVKALTAKGTEPEKRGKEGEKEI